MNFVLVSLAMIEGLKLLRRVMAQRREVRRIMGRERKSWYTRKEWKHSKGGRGGESEDVCGFLYIRAKRFALYEKWQKCKGEKAHPLHLFRNEYDMLSDRFTFHSWKLGVRREIESHSLILFI